MGGQRLSGGNPFKAWLIAPQATVGRDTDIEAIESVLGAYKRVHHDGWVTANAIRDAFEGDLGIGAHKGPRLVWVLAEAVQDKAGNWCLNTYGLERLPIADLWGLMCAAARRRPEDRMVVIVDVCNAAGAEPLPDSMAAFIACGADEKTVARDTTGGWLTQELVKALRVGVNTPIALLDRLVNNRPGTQIPEVHEGAHPGVPINSHWPAPVDEEAIRQRRQRAINCLQEEMRDIFRRAPALGDHFAQWAEDNGDPPSNDVVQSLCTMSGGRFARWLFSATSKHRQQLEAIQELACRVMPILTDWQAIQANLNRAVRMEQWPVRVPVVDLSICEVIIAGVEVRAAAFIEGLAACVGILADARQAQIHQPAFFGAPLLPSRKAEHMPNLVAEAIVKASGQTVGTDVFEQARGVLDVTQDLYRSYLVVPDALARVTVDALLDKDRGLPGLMLVQTMPDSALVRLASSLRTALNTLFPPTTQDAHAR